MKGVLETIDVWYTGHMLSYAVIRLEWSSSVIVLHWSHLISIFLQKELPNTVR
jgi:hypothetical protein